MFHSRCTRVQQRKQTKLPKRTTQEIQMRTTGESCIYIVGPGLLDELKPTDRPKSAGTTSLELLLPRGNTGSWLTRPSTFEECQKLWFLCKISLFLNITYFVNFLKMVWVNKTCCVKGKYFPSWWFFRRRDIMRLTWPLPTLHSFLPWWGKMTYRTDEFGRRNWAFITQNFPFPFLFELRPHRVLPWWRAAYPRPAWEVSNSGILYRKPYWPTPISHILQYPVSH